MTRPARLALYMVRPLCARTMVARTPALIAHVRRLAHARGARTVLVHGELHRVVV